MSTTSAADLAPAGSRPSGPAPTGPVPSGPLPTGPLPTGRVGSATLARLLGPLPPGAPAYRALADALHRAVRDGSLPLGTRVPSERELAAALGVSRTTTSAAYDRLRDLGVLRTRRGSGSVTDLPGAAPTGPVVLGSADGTSDGSLPGVVDLTAAAPEAPRALAAAAERALERLPRHATGGGYAYLGLPELRARIAERYTARGVPTSPDEVLVTSGAQHATSLLLDVLVGLGDRVVVDHPGYPQTFEAIRSAGGRPVPLPVGAAGHDLDVLEDTLRQAAPRLVHLTPDHHNPTGTSLDADQRARVRDLAARFRTLVVADETLTDLTLDGPVPEPFCGPTPDRHLVAVGSASKTFWGGLRLGWVRAHRDLVARLGQARVPRDLGTAVLDQLVLLELLEAEDEVLAERRAALRERRDALLAAVRAVGWQAETPPGGLSVWVDLGAPLSSALAAVAPRHGVRVVPGSAFGLDGSFERRLRLPFAPRVADLERGVAGLTAAWRTLAPTAAGATTGTEPAGGVAVAV